MTTLYIVPDADGAFPELKDREVVRTNEFAVGGLAGGMTNGAPAVVTVIELPDGRVVFAETSLALFLTAADVFKDRYGDPRYDAKGQKVS